ncbi:MAG: hypothetical protein EXR39_07985 [Betaproteobacteria bacterium]|nr:hypothetical protein [Betaproteobacteria bacterium]
MNEPVPITSTGTRATEDLAFEQVKPGRRDDARPQVFDRGLHGIEDRTVHASLAKDETIAEGPIVTSFI